MMFINAVSFPGENGTDRRKCVVCGAPIDKAILIPVQPDYHETKNNYDFAEMCCDCADNYIEDWNQQDPWTEAYDYNFSGEEGY